MNHEYRMLQNMLIDRKIGTDERLKKRKMWDGRTTSRSNRLSKLGYF